MSVRQSSPKELLYLLGSHILYWCVNMKSASVVLLLAMLLMASGSVSVLTASVQNPQWKAYDFVSKYFAVYDFDGDGVQELIAFPSNVIDNYVVLSTPYPKGDAGYTLDLDLDGVNELVVQQSSTFYIYKGMNAVTSYFLPGQVNIDPWGRALAVGNTVIYNMTTYTFRDATSPVFPITVTNRLYVVYLSGSVLKISDHTGWSVNVYSGNMVSILGVGLYLGNFYVLGRTLYGDSVLIVYNTYSGSTSVTGFTIPFDKVVTFITLSQSFIATSGENVYRIYTDRAVLEYIGDVLWFDGSYMYIYREEGVVDVYAPAFSRNITSLPVPSKPVTLGGRYPLVAFSDGNKTYVLVDLPPIIMRLTAPSTVYAGEKFMYYLDVYNAENYTLLFNGVPIPTQGYMTINVSGTYKFTASATNGVLTETIEQIIQVQPRPITIRIYISGIPRAFSESLLTVRVTDVLNGAAVRDTSCTLKLGNESPRVVEPWIGTPVMLTPMELSKNLASVEIVCGDNKYYKQTVYKDTIFLYAASVTPDIEYLGEGTIRVRMLAPDNQTEAPGSIQVYINEEYVGTQPLPALITGIPAGNSTVRIRYMPNVLTFAPATYTFEVTYYKNASDVPEEFRASLLVADVVEYINVTQTIEVPTTVTVPVQVPVEVPVLDTVLTLVIAGGATAAGAAAGVFIPRILKRRKTESTVEAEAEVDTEPA